MPAFLWDVFSVWGAIMPPMLLKWGMRLTAKPHFISPSAPSCQPLGGDIPFPRGTDDCHFEVELTVALASGGKDIAATDAMGHIYGYGVGLDMTRRDLQAAAKDKRRPWCIAKDYENSALFSPITTKDAFGALAAQRIWLTKNDEIVQDSTIDLMVHKVPELIAHLSRFYELRAGDIIMTGTPEGVGPIAPGDRLIGQVTGADAIDVTFI